MYFASKTETFAKLLFVVSCTGLFMYVILAFYTFHTAYSSSMFQFQNNEDNIPSLPVPEYKAKSEKHRRDTKYILLWTLNETNEMDEGNKPFLDQGCPYTNCYLTANKFLLDKDYTRFEAIIFDVRNFIKLLKKNLPDSRSEKQKYVFYSKTSSDDAPVCSIVAENYFNWTWTYKLDSDIFAPFIEVRDFEGNVVAPRPVVNWNSNMTSSNVREMEYLKHKKKAVAWIVNKCETKNERMTNAKRLQRLFRANALDFDMYGCGNLVCPKEGCLNALKRDYYFCYTPEDSHGNDYVTSEIVTGYNSYAVPIVKGGADYKKFMPEGFYINAESSPGGRLAALVEYIIKNPKIYYSFHRWRKYYSISITKKFKGICEICKFLNDENKFRSKSVKESLRKWWFPRPLYSRCMPKGAENLSDVLSYLNESSH